MDAFLLLPDQLFYKESVIKELSLHDMIYLVEDPVYFSDRSCTAKMIQLRTCMREYFKHLRAELPKISPRPRIRIHYVNVADVIRSGGTVFKYLSGIRMRLNMYRQSCTWAYGEEPWDAKYHGININWLESPAFLISYRNIRNKCSSRVRYRPTTVATMAFGKKRQVKEPHLGGKTTHPERNCRDYLNAKNYVYGIQHTRMQNFLANQTKYYPHTRKEALQYTDKVCPEMIFALNVGMLTPDELAETPAVSDLIVWRERERLLYLSQYKKIKWEFIEEWRQNNGSAGEKAFIGVINDIHNYNMYICPWVFEWMLSDEK